MSREKDEEARPAPRARRSLPVDVRVQLGLLVALSVAVFAARSPRGVALSAALLAGLLALSRTPASTVARGLRPTAVVLAFSLLANSLVATPQGLVVSGEGAVRGILAVVRIVVVVGYAVVVAAGTTAEEVAGAIAGLVRPLGRLGVPVGDLSLATTVALRFVPVVSDEVGRVTAAQRSRGARVNEGGLGERLRQWGRVLVPVVVGLFRRSDELAVALYDRCYGVAEPTSLLPAVTRRDVAALVAGLALAVAVWLW